MKHKTLYLECASGISGDMFVGAMLDLGADAETLERALDSLSVDGFSTEISEVSKAGILCRDFRVVLDKDHENHDHDMEWLYGHSHHSESKEECCRKDTSDCGPGWESEENGKKSGHCHVDGEEHGAACVHVGESGCRHGHIHGEGDCGHHHGEHEHRRLSDIYAIIDGANMTESAKALARRMFDIIGEAESAAHGLPIEEVHFHEVGAVDSIVDIVAAAVCFDNLDVREVIVTGLCEGRGTVRCQHGILPIPVPATLHIARIYGLPLILTEAEGEFVTPTGAAIAAALMTSRTLPSSFVVKSVGIGAGKRKTEKANILRAMFIEETESDAESVLLLETDIDDASGEMLGHASKKLMKAGAKDVHYTPVYMKKNRPGYMLSVLCDKTDGDRIKDIIFRETTTIGIREQLVKRVVLRRETVKIKTKYGKAIVKMAWGRGFTKCYPEYESVKALAKKTGVCFSDIFDEVKHKGEKIRKQQIC